jgi:UDP-N-acetylglucosamine--N-acetylmuramyl-(pentapeptide) pyrophosphoryl-undecaprenol N-acetylglucosamine transferase
MAVATELRDRGVDVTFVGSPAGQEALLVPAAGYPFVAVDVLPAQTRVSLRSFKALLAAFRAARQLRPVVEASDVVVGIGGFASAPGALAARRARRPLVLIEPNSYPGIVNRAAARWARVVATTFEATTERLPSGTRVVRTGNPIRREIASVKQRQEELAAEARAVFGLAAGRGTVLVVGGSQGALGIDRVVAGMLPVMAARADLQLLVSTGREHAGVVPDMDDASGLLVRALPFIDRMELALALADLAVSRSGASVAELTACGIPSILIPYPHATEDHQRANARELAAAGAAVMVDQATLSPSGLASSILELMDDGERRGRMTEAALAWARPDAAARIADLVQEAAR